MRLVVDASALVAEALRRRGLVLIEHPNLELFIALPAWSEALHELRRRTLLREAQGRLEAGTADNVLRRTIDLIEANVARVPEASYRRFEHGARVRIPRDPRDWPTVAVAMLLGAGIWTQDGDFLGCGLPTWTTETLLAYLQA